MKIKGLIGPVLLLLTAAIWGLSFVAQSEGLEHMGELTFNGVRMLMGAAVLMPVIILRRKKHPVVEGAESKKEARKVLITASVVVGICLCIGTNLQQYAFSYLPVGKVGFITALYMLFVPLFGLIFKKRPPFTAWIGVVIGLAGLYLLCMGNTVSLSFGTGEFLTFLGAIAFAFHILAIDILGAKVDAAALACGQFLVTGVISMIGGFIFENPSIEGMRLAIIPLLYTGIMSSGVAFTFQIIGQKRTEPTLASMLLCFESVFSVFFGFLILHQEFKKWEYIGCIIMFLAIIIAQIPVKKKSAVNE